MGHIASGTIDIHHMQGFVAGIGQLVKLGRRQVDDLPGFDFLAFGIDTNLAASLYDKIDLFLLLIMPGHLATIRFENDIAHGEALRFNRLATLPDQTAGPTTRGKLTTLKFRKICYDHVAVSNGRDRIGKPESERLN